METIIFIHNAKEVVSQQMGKNYSLVIPNYSGPRNDLRIILTAEVCTEVIKDMRAVCKSVEIQTTEQLQKRVSPDQPK